MSLVYSDRGGLLVAEHGADAVSVERALKDHDRSLLLIPPGVQFADRPQRNGWRVYRKAGGDRPPEFLCFWGDDHANPYPLSHGLVDLVKQMDRNTRARYLDDIAANAIRQAEIDKRVERDNEALKDDYLPMEGRSPVLHRGQGLRRSRDKRRARGEKV